MTGHQTGAQTVLVVAMGIVTTAVAVALYRHIGLPGPVASTAAFAAFTALVAGHMLAWRREQRPARRASATPRAPRDRRELELRRLKDEPQAAPRSQSRAPRQPGPPPLPPQAPGREPSRPQTRHAAAERAAPPPLPAGPAVPNAARDFTDDDQDFWSYRPTPNPIAQRSDDLPPFVAGRVPAPSPGLGTPEPRLPDPKPRAETAPAAKSAEPTRPEPQAATTGATPKEADVEVIQDAIKRLLEEVNAAERTESKSAAASGKATETSVDQAIDALRMTAGTMRAAAAPAPRSVAPENAPKPPPLPPFVRGAAPGPRPMSPGDAQARLMADAISAGRIDVTLEPILGLEDQQTRHYEVCVRLRDSDGNVLDVTPDGPDLRGTGLLPLFDGVRITRTAAVARRLEERGKAGAVFSAFSGESVADEHFLGELAETLHQRAGLATQLVLSFTQSDVRGFSTPEWDSLADMRALGFRFALSHITDLDMDFEALAEQGFAFVKLDASVFLEGLPAPSGHLPSSDVCRHLAQHGLTLVVERIDDEEKLARVFGFGVLLGQGQLFGGPRPVRADVIRTRSATAAA